MGIERLESRLWFLIFNAKKVKKRGCTSDELFIKVSCVLKIDEDIRYQGNFDLLNKLKFVQIFAISPSI